MPPRFVNSAAFGILDILDADKGWLTSQCLVDMFPWVQEKSVRRNLYRLRERGMVISRPRPNFVADGSVEHEWKITSAGVRRIDRVAA